MPRPPGPPSRPVWSWVFSVALPLGCIAGPCQPAPGPPPPDACASASSDGVTAIEVAPDTDPFTAFADGDVATPRIGGQGLYMLPIRIRVAGPGQPACLAQTTQIHGFQGQPPMDTVLAQDTVARATYPDGNRRVTKGVYVVFNDQPAPGDPIRLSVQVGAVTLTRTLLFATRGAGLDLAGATSLPDGASDL